MTGETRTARRGGNDGRFALGLVATGIFAALTFACGGGGEGPSTNSAPSAAGSRSDANTTQSATTSEGEGGKPDSEAVATPAASGGVAEDEVAGAVKARGDAAADVPRSGIEICDQLVEKVEKCIDEIKDEAIQAELRPLLSEDAGAWSQTVKGGGAASSVEIGCRSAKGIWRERLRPHGCWRDDPATPGKIPKTPK